jgi:hypothetical protein
MCPLTEWIVGILDTILSCGGKLSRWYVIRPQQRS